MKQHWVMDYETLVDCFVGVFEATNSDDRKIFICSKQQNDIAGIIEFLKQNLEDRSFHFSFNGLAFDAQVSEFILKNSSTLLNDSEPATKIYEFVQNKLISAEKSQFGPRLPYANWELSIPQVDLYKLNHWDNPAKSSSLKWIQCSMDWENVQEMPLNHTTHIETQEQLDMIVSYCINDVRSTKKILDLSREQINLRIALTKEYGIDLYSASEPRISKELFAYFLTNRLNIDKRDLKQLRTRRTQIVVKDIILPYIHFKTPQLKKILEEFKKIVINPNETKGSLKLSMKDRGVKTDFGLGGVHGAADSGVYKSDKDIIIMSSDVTSFYPNLAIRNKWSPGHLDAQAFCELYEWFFEERKKIPKKDPKNYVYKIILNSTYGLSNDENSFLYDPEFTMRITINGQLSLMLLYEMIVEAIPDAKPLMQNTDGLETIIPRDKINTYMEVCSQWEQLTSLQLEHETYQKLVLADVNNYIAVTEFKELPDKDSWLGLQKAVPYYVYKISAGRFMYAATKCKGRFEFTGLALHKNKSNLVIPKALFEYFVKGIPVEQYLMDNRNILDYCMVTRSRGDWYFAESCIVDGVFLQNKLQHVIRYYVSHKGCKIIKYNSIDGRETKSEAGPYLQTVYNEIKDRTFEEYGVNTAYYLRAIESEIDNIQKTHVQLNLFL